MIYILQPRTDGDTSDQKQCVLCYENLTKIKKLSRDEARKWVKKVKTFCNSCPKKPTMCFNNLFNVLMTLSILLCLT